MTLVLNNEEIEQVLSMDLCIDALQTMYAEVGRWVGFILLFSTHTGEPLMIAPDGYMQSATTKSRCS